MNPVMTSPSGSTSITGTLSVETAAELAGVTWLHSLYRSWLSGPIPFSSAVSAGILMTVPSLAVIRPTAATRTFIFGCVYAHLVRFFAMIVCATPCVIMRFGGVESAASSSGSGPIEAVWQATMKMLPSTASAMLRARRGARSFGALILGLLPWGFMRSSTIAGSRSLRKLRAAPAAERRIAVVAGGAARAAGSAQRAPETLHRHLGGDDAR